MKKLHWEELVGLESAASFHALILAVRADDNGPFFDSAVNVIATK